VTTAGALAGTSTPASDSAGSATAAMSATDSAPFKQTGAQLLAAFPPRPIVSSWPATEAGRTAALARVLGPPFALDNPLSQQTRRLGVLAVLSWLQTFPGASWQQRWQASGAEDQLDWRDLLTAASAGRARSKVAAGARLPHLGPGLLVLICADVIRPSVGWPSVGSPRPVGAWPPRWPARATRRRSPRSPRRAPRRVSGCRPGSRH
jgi:hypothetical protein